MLEKEVELTLEQLESISAGRRRKAMKLNRVARSVGCYNLDDCIYDLQPGLRLENIGREAKLISPTFSGLILSTRECRDP